MKYVLYILLILLAFLNVTNAYATFSSSATTALGSVEAIFVALGSLFLVVSVFGLFQKKAWGFNISLVGLGLTFASGVISIIAGYIWLMQLVLPVVGLAILLTTKKS